MLMNFQDVLNEEERLRELRNRIWRNPDCPKHGRDALKVCSDCGLLGLRHGVPISSFRIGLDGEYDF